MRFRQIKQEIAGLLMTDDFQESLEIICSFGLNKAISPLISLFNSRDELQRWRAVSGLGFVTTRLATSEMESARVVMRRLMWMLNDESGGIGWGAPEAMGDITARHQGLADEYARILISYLNPSGNYLEHPMLQRGLLWGLARLAHARPEHTQKATDCLQPFLVSADPIHRGLAAWTLAAQQDSTVQTRLAPLRADHSPITVYWGYTLQVCSVSQLTKKSTRSPENPC